MTAVELIRGEALAVLKAAGLEAVAAYERMTAAKQEGAVIAVGVGKIESGAAGLGDYLGERLDEETLVVREEYGRRATVELTLNAYAPRNGGAAACAAALEAAHDALLSGSGAFRHAGMEWGKVAFDKDSGLFLQQGTLRCEVFFVAVVEEESQLLLDFKLKGALET